MTQIGRGYKGSPYIETSTTMHQVVPPKPEGWSLGYNFYKFSFVNNMDCTVIINNQSEIFLPITQGFNIDENDAPIYSFVIKESGVTYNFVGAYR